MNDKLKEISEENLIIWIYFILLGIYLYANVFEINYIEFGNEKDKKIYRFLIFLVFTVSFVINFYYVVREWQSICQEKYQKIKELEKISLFANILLLIATGIYIYIICKDENIDLEISP